MWFLPVRLMSTSNPIPRSRTPLHPPRFRPRLEVLEGRDVPSTLTVTNTLDNGKGSLRYEIAHASKNSLIVFAPSLDGQTITLTSGELDITKGMTIEGPGADKLTISGGHHSRVFAVNASTSVTVSGLTISDGTAFPSNLAIPFWGDGGGILNLSTLVLAGCTVSNNDAIGDIAPAFGGGIYNAGNMSVTNCIVKGNRASTAGGGIYNASPGNLFVYSSAFSSNFSFDPFYGWYSDNIYGQYADQGGNNFG
jgi:hypothetical protein